MMLTGVLARDVGLISGQTSDVLQSPAGARRSSARSAFFGSLAAPQADRLAAADPRHAGAGSDRPRLEPARRVHGARPDAPVRLFGVSGALVRAPGNTKIRRRRRITKNNLDREGHGLRNQSLGVLRPLSFATPRSRRRSRSRARSMTSFVLLRLLRTFVFPVVIETPAAEDEDRRGDDELDAQRDPLGERDAASASTRSRDRRARSRAGQPARGTACRPRARRGDGAATPPGST